MREIEEIMEDFRNGKRLSQPERPIALAYIQGKYDTERELKICNNSNAIEVLDKIRAEIKALEDGISSYHNDRPWVFKDEVLQIIDKYRTESEG